MRTDWPGGAQVAVSLTFDVDAESALLHGQPGIAARMSVMSHQAYGPLVGAGLYAVLGPRAYRNYQGGTPTADAVTSATDARRTL
jgi:hypothetical protein